MLKILGLTAIFFACTAAGIAASSGLRDKVVFLAAVRLFTEEMSIAISYRSDSVYRIFLGLRKNRLLTPIMPLLDVRLGELLPQWESAARKCAPDKECFELVCEIGSFLGKSDLAGQLSELSMYKLKVDTMLKNAEAAYSERSKLYRSLGVISGAFIAVLLI